LSATLKARLAYLLATVVILTVEVVIALFVRDDLVRPYVGDTLAVVLVYCALRAATPLSSAMAIAASLGLAVVIELGQLFHVLNAVGLADNRLARVVLGGVLDLKDLAAYATGAVLIAIVEGARKRRR
jgi:CBS-domain-containing membrane protein